MSSIPLGFFSGIAHLMLLEMNQAQYNFHASDELVIAW